MSSTMQMLLNFAGVGSHNPLTLEGEAFNEGKGVISSKEADDKTGAAAILPLKFVLAVCLKECDLARRLFLLLPVVNENNFNVFSVTQSFFLDGMAEVAAVHYASCRTLEQQGREDDEGKG
jgi:hypothetical protein